MNNQSKIVVAGDEILGEVSAYSALPAVKCPSCGSNLHRIFNTHTQWEFICLSEKILVAPGMDVPPLQVTVE